MINPVQDTQRMGYDRIGAGSAEIVRRQPFQYFVGQAIGCGECQLECRIIGDSGAIQVRGLQAFFTGQSADLG
ncbi:hypothetical protein SDC9_205390 [bioreactor metagenome]|uniref:Uncharacterized protein n=1 Tax=bioreactor metagenome TaxID=1076179 RepID=A0A645J2N6_9ZZZZ